MSSGWKLVEAVVESTEDPKAKAKKGNTYEKKPFRRNRRHQPKDYNSMDAKEKEATLQYAISQIKYIFSEDNLCLDTFIRSYMDEQGYVPLALIYCYPNVLQSGVPQYDIAQAIENSQLPELEINSQLQIVKLKEKWERWLMPNYMGGLGLPSYATQIVQDFTYYYDLSYSSESEQVEGESVDTQSITSISTESVPVKSTLSATAKEFQPSQTVPNKTL